MPDHGAPRGHVHASPCLRDIFPASPASPFARPHACPANALILFHRVLGTRPAYTGPPAGSVRWWQRRSASKFGGWPSWRRVGPGNSRPSQQDVGALGMSEGAGLYRKIAVGTIGAHRTGDVTV